MPHAVINASVMRRRSLAGNGQKKNRDTHKERERERSIDIHRYISFSILPTEAGIVALSLL